MEPTRFHESEKPRKKITGNRVEFDVDRQSKLIMDRGVHVLWEKSYLCPCRNRMTKAPDTSCPICHGRGIAYLPAKKTMIAVQSQERSPNNADIGLYDSGTAIGTTLPESKITFRDRITLPDVEVEHSLLFDVTQRRIDSGMWLAYDVKQLTYVVNTDGEILYEGDDYTLDVDKNLFFPNEKHKGKNISMNLETILRYIVTDLLKESRIQYTQKGNPTEKLEKMPKKLLLKREDAWVNPIPLTMDEDDVPTEFQDDPKRTMSTGGFFGGALGG